MLKDDRDISANSQISKIKNVYRYSGLPKSSKIKTCIRKEISRTCIPSLKNTADVGMDMFLHVGNQLTMSPGYPSDRLQKARGRKIVLRPPEFIMSVLTYCRLPGFRPHHYKPRENGCVNQITFI